MDILEECFCSDSVVMIVRNFVMSDYVSTICK